MMENENLQRDIEAIEEEKKAFLEGDLDDSGEEEEVEYETEETEFSLTPLEIEEWISELMRLKEEKGYIELDVDEENTLKINYGEESDSNEDDSEELKGDEIIE